jgi:hypothetical protein
MRPDIGHADASGGGHDPDNPFFDIGKGLDAAKHIYDIIPDKCGCATAKSWDDVRNGLITAWGGNQPVEYSALGPLAAPKLDARVRGMQRAIQNLFGDRITYNVNKAASLYENTGGF